VTLEVCHAPIPESKEAAKANILFMSVTRFVFQYPIPWSVGFAEIRSSFIFVAEVEIPHNSASGLGLTEVGSIAIAIHRGSFLAVAAFNVSLSWTKEWTTMTWRIWLWGGVGGGEVSEIRSKDSQ
jgi:hypothetical protein